MRAIVNDSELFGTDSSSILYLLGAVCIWILTSSSGGCWGMKKKTGKTFSIVLHRWWWRWYWCGCRRYQGRQLSLPTANRGCRKWIMNVWLLSLRTLSRKVSPRPVGWQKEQLWCRNRFLVQESWAGRCKMMYFYRPGDFVWPWAYRCSRFFYWTVFIVTQITPNQ